LLLARETERDVSGVSPSAFVISTGRCGSTLLSQLLRAHPSVLSISELFTSLGGASWLGGADVDGKELARKLSTPASELEDLLRRQAPPEVLAKLSGELLARLPPPLLITFPFLSDHADALFAELLQYVRRLPVDAPARQVDRVFTWLCRRLGRRRWVERSGGSVEYVEHLLGAWPKAKTIWLLRDGVSCARSMSEHPMFRMRVAGLMQPRPDGCDDIPLDRFGAYWSALMAKTMRHLRRAPSELVLVIRYEDLLDEPSRTLLRLAHFLELDGAPEWISHAAAIIRRPEVSLGDLSKTEQHALARSCRPGMRCLDDLQALAS
jgi:hypothetical protein